MKRLFCFISAVILLVSVACADDLPGFIQDWNKIAYIFGAPELSEESAAKDGDNITFSGAGWDMTVTLTKASVYSVVIHADTVEMFLPLCVNAGASVVKNKTVETLSRFQSNVLYQFLQINADAPGMSSMFGLYLFRLSKTESGDLFEMVEQ